MSGTRNYQPSNEMANKIQTVQQQVLNFSENAAVPINLESVNKSIQYNKNNNLAGDEFFVFNDFSKRVSIQNTRPGIDAPLHVANNLGSIIQAPVCTNQVVVSNTVIAPPVNYNITAQYSPEQPTGERGGYYFIPDIAIVAINKSNVIPTEGGFSASSTIEYEIYGYVELEGSGYVVGNVYNVFITDTDPTGNFYVDIEITPGVGGEYNGFIITRREEGFIGVTRLNGGGTYTDTGTFEQIEFQQSLYQANVELTPGINTPVEHTFEFASYIHNPSNGQKYTSTWQQVAVTTPETEKGVIVFNFDISNAPGGNPVLIKTPENIIVDVGTNNQIYEFFGHDDYRQDTSQIAPFSSISFSLSQNIQYKTFNYDIFSNSNGVYSRLSFNTSVEIDNTIPGGFIFRHYLDPDDIPPGAVVKIITVRDELEGGISFEYEGEFGELFFETATTFISNNTTVTPNTIGFQSSTVEYIEYKVYSIKTIGTDIVYSSPFDFTVNIPPNTGLKYIVNIEIEDQGQGFDYQINRRINGAQESYYKTLYQLTLSDHPGQEYPDYYMGPEGVYKHSSIYAEKSIYHVSEQGISHFLNSEDVDLSYNNFGKYVNNNPITIGKYGVRDGDFFVGCENQRLLIGNTNQGTNHTSIGSANSHFNAEGVNGIDYTMNVFGTVNTQGLSASIRNVSNTYHVTVTDFTIVCNDNADNIYLHAPHFHPGKIYFIKNRKATITHVFSHGIDNTIGEIEGLPFYIIPSGESRTFQSNGYNGWIIIF